MAKRSTRVCSKGGIRDERSIDLLKGKEQQKNTKGVRDKVSNRALAVGISMLPKGMLEA
jgi:hypothetical protein